MKANFKHDQTLLIKKTKNNIKRNSSNATVFWLVREYCRLSKLLDPSERDIERISAILELAQYDSELNCLINEADHLIADELRLSEELEEFHTNFMVSEQENKEICCGSTTISYLTALLAIMQYSFYSCPSPSIAFSFEDVSYMVLKDSSFPILSVCDRYDI